ncbi:hypothetical protein T484DRAFT_1832345, partial [Baffinella frigidus]
PDATLTVGAKDGKKTGTYAYKEMDEDAILAGKAYVNIHTAANTGGEIRGQILLDQMKFDEQYKSSAAR